MFLALLLAYLLGSIPFGLLLTRAAGLGDVRNIGSGNIGATNVLRTGNKPLAAATLLLDGLKGLLAVLLALHLAGHTAAVFAALFAVFGHVFPIWLKGRGGKGVATSIGVFLGLSAWLGLGVIVLWGAVFAVWRISSLAALAGVGAAPLLCLLAGQYTLLPAALPIATLVFWRHKDNIERLRNGTEHRFRT